MAFASFWKRVPDMASPVAPPQAGQAAVQSAPAHGVMPVYEIAMDADRVRHPRLGGGHALTALFERIITMVMMREIDVPVRAQRRIPALRKSFSA